MRRFRSVYCIWHEVDEAASGTSRSTTTTVSTAGGTGTTVPSSSTTTTTAPGVLAAFDMVSWTGFA
ncbi:MAG: hypothetical protein M0000_00895, partial [Actinomycetota bacterium]|nr:hypothetical protein [Actinomycetota bacterium]